MATLGKTPVGRQLAVAGEDVIVGAAHVEKAVATGVKSEGAVVAGSKATEKTGRPLLDALDDAVKSGKAKSPEPWVYHPENRGVLKDLPKGGSADIKPVGDSVESITQASSTHSSNPNDIVRLAFRGRPNPPLIDVNKHKFLRGK